MHPYEVLRRPIISEKATLLQEGNKYVLKVAKETNKAQIKQAVELAFKVKVSKVNVITIPGKTKRMGRREVTSSPWKKAVITLGPGDKISFFEGV
jgi:large subunit ribosomal protein L23